MQPDKVTSKALALKLFGLDGLILLTGCRESFFMLHVQIRFSEEMVFVHPISKPMLGKEPYKL